MHVFVTGASGFIGSAVVPELLKNGHTVLALARSDSSAEKLAKIGVDVHRGDLEDVESLKSGAKAADGVIHLAFIHDFSPDGHKKALAADRAAVEAYAEALEGTNKPVVIATGCLTIAGYNPATEDDGPIKPDSLFGERHQAEALIRKLSTEKGFRGSIIRLSPTVHGPKDTAFIPILMNMARKNGFVTCVDDGMTRWPAVHLFDAVELFRLALEKGKAGAWYHAVAEQGVVMKDIFETMSNGLGLPVKSTSLEEAKGLLGFFAVGISTDDFVSSRKTQEELGWTPTHPGLLADMEANYFK